MGRAVEKAEKKKVHYSVEEYFALEQTAEHKSEYYGGKILAMSGSSVAHDRICMNFYAQFDAILRGKPCEAFTSNMKLGIPSSNRYFYPDASVVCGDLKMVEGRNDTLANALLVVEVLSDSTEDKDRGEKFQYYQRIPGFREYVLVSQKEISVEVFFRLDEKTWEYRRYTEEDRFLPLKSLEIELELAALYARVKFGAPEGGEGKN